MSLQVYSILAVLWLTAEARAAVDFLRQVHPILAARCLSCHGANNPQGGLTLTTRAGVLRTVTPGDSKGSVLLQRINGDKPPRMPMGGDPLTPEEIALIEAWIDEGAKGGDETTPAAPTWNAQLAPRRPDPPTAAANPIDAFLGTTNAPTVSDTLFARRVYLDLWGLPNNCASLNASPIAANSSTACLRTKTTTPSTGSASGTTYCVTTTASSTTGSASPSRRGSTRPCATTCPTTAL